MTLVTIQFDQTILSPELIRENLPKIAQIVAEILNKSDTVEVRAEAHDALTYNTRRLQVTISTEPTSYITQYAERLCNLIAMGICLDTTFPKDEFGLGKLYVYLKFVQGYFLSR